jgi:hypothetical protein
VSDVFSLKEIDVVSEGQEKRCTKTNKYTLRMDKNQTIGAENTAASFEDRTSLLMMAKLWQKHVVKAILKAFKLFQQKLSCM